MTFVRPAQSVGMYFGNDELCCGVTEAFSAYLDIYGSSGLLDTIGVQANMNDFVDQFIGFNSDTPVTSVTIRYGSGSDVELYHYIDDFQFSIPEPSTFILFAFALLSLCASRRTRRS
jgi:hypothetical protein